MWLHYDSRVLPLARLARILWSGAVATRALQLAKTGLQDAEFAGHKLSICYALGEALCPLHFMAGDIGAAAKYTSILSEIAARHGFGFWERFAHCLEAVLLIRQGNTSEGSRLLRSAFEDFNHAGQTLHCSGFVGEFVQALAQLGNTAEASSVIEDALSRSRQEGASWHVPELLRMKGEVLLLQRDGRSYPDAERMFGEAIELARTQSALFWELRAAVSLAALKSRQGEPAAARTVLTRISESFSADTTFLDLETARQLLNELPAVPADKRRRRADRPLKS